MRGMEERSRRIIEAAIELAEDGGFEAVRLRDVAALANVALGTLYKRFSSKEDILIAALENEMGLVDQLMHSAPRLGDRPHERIRAFFTVMTEGLVAKPKLARAVLKAVASGNPDLTERVARFHDGVAALTLHALLGGDDGEEVPAGTDSQRELVFLLSHVWFAALVGWMGNLHGTDTVIERVDTAARWMLAGWKAEQNG